MVFATKSGVGYCIYGKVFVSLLSTMQERNPYKVVVKKWRKRNRIIAVTDNPVEVVDKVTGEVRTATPYVGNRCYRDTTDFVKLYEPLVLMKMKPYGVKVFAYMVSRMGFGGVIQFDYDECMSLSGLSRSTVYRGIVDLIEQDVVRKKSRTEYWINPNVVFRGQREDFEMK